MSLVKIYSGFVAEINSIIPTIDTVYENTSYTPTNGTPYQEVYIIPASDDNMYINEAGYVSLGLLQITLYYPINKGLGDILNRVELYKEHFKNKTYFEKNGLKINIQGGSKVVSLGTSGDRIIYLFRIAYKAYI